MEVVGHDDKFVKLIFSLGAIVEKGFGEQSGSGVAAKDGATLRSHGGDEERSVILLMGEDKATRTARM